jgi:hypothetical protein
MEYTDHQKQEFKDQFTKRRRRQLMFFYSPIVILIMLLLSIDETTGQLLGFIPASIFTPVSIIALVGVLIFSIKNWKCPACNHYFEKAFNPSFCSKCGVKLR